MAGWSNSTGTSAGGGRGAGGRGFTNRHYTNNTSDMIHGGSTSGGGRWRGDRSRGRPPPQPQFCYRPVSAAHRQSQPVSEQQAASSTPNRTAQLTHPTSTAGKSSASGTAAPLSTKELDDKASRSAANFECNVCFDMAAEPVVTKCGHLFCWECLYQWLHVHSNHRECPVCKGQVADDAIIPIYGRGGSAASVDSAPPRPTGTRVESSRQQQQLPPFAPAVFVDDEEDPFDLPGMMNFGFGDAATSLREAVMNFVPRSFEDMGFEEFDDYSYEYDTDDFDEVYDYDWLGFPMFASAGAESGNPTALQAYVDMINIRNNIVNSTTGIHHPQVGYPGANPHNRGRRRRNRPRPPVDNSSPNGMVMGSSGAFYRDNSASSNVAAGASSRPTSGWVERRGRSSRNSNSTGGRAGMQDSRRQRTNYN